jgi:DNA-binding CsgD family transcriptional regulator
MATGQLRDDDVRRLLDVLEDARHDDPGEAMPWALLEGLQRLVPCDLCVSYQEHDFVACSTLWVQHLFPGGHRESGGPFDPDPDDPFWQLWWSSACSWPQRTGVLHHVLLSADLFPTERERRSNPFHDLLECQDEMMVSLPAAPGRARRILFFRATSPRFTEHDRQLVELLRPHLQEIWLDAERRRGGVPPLTAREWQVLALAGTGLPYADIAARLFLSPGTVRKHMEHIRARLGVHSVAAAAALALPHAPFGQRPRPEAGVAMITPPVTTAAGPPRGWRSR